MLRSVSKLNSFSVYLVIKRTKLLLNKEEIPISYKQNHIKMDGDNAGSTSFWWSRLKLSGISSQHVTRCCVLLHHGSTAARLAFASFLFHQPELQAIYYSVLVYTTCHAPHAYQYEMNFWKWIEIILTWMSGDKNQQKPLWKPVSCTNTSVEFDWENLT